MTINNPQLSRQVRCAAAHLQDYSSQKMSLNNRLINALSASSQGVLKEGVGHFLYVGPKGLPLALAVPNVQPLITWHYIDQLALKEFG